eukprot:scaffold365239_cov56-Attheya_sp.AAC.1
MGSDVVLLMERRAGTTGGMIGFTTAVVVCSTTFGTLVIAVIILPFVCCVPTGSTVSYAVVVLVASGGGCWNVSAGVMFVIGMTGGHDGSGRKGRLLLLWHWGGNWSWSKGWLLLLLLLWIVCRRVGRRCCHGVVVGGVGHANGWGLHHGLQWSFGWVEEPSWRHWQCGGRPCQCLG